jgi:hypothetical protein
MVKIKVTINISDQIGAIGSNESREDTGCKDKGASRQAAQAASPSMIPTLITHQGEAGIASTTENREAGILT